VLTNRLVRLAPNLRAIGIDVVHDRSGTARTVKVSKVGNGASRASRASSFEREPDVPRDARDADDAGRKASGVETVLSPASDRPDASDAATGANTAGPNWRVVIGPDERHAESSHGIEDATGATEGAFDADHIEPFPPVEIESGLDPNVVAAFAVFGADIVLPFPPPAEAVPQLLASTVLETSDTSQPEDDHLDLGDGHRLLDLPTGGDYPAVAWEPGEVADDPQADSWTTAPLAGPAE